MSRKKNLALGMDIGKEVSIEAEILSAKEYAEARDLVPLVDVDPVEFLVHIEGIRPLMFKRFPSADEKPLPSGSIADPAKEAEKGLYRDGKKGTIYLPAEHIEGALINAGKGFKIPGLGKKTFKDEIAQNVIVEPQQIPFKVPSDPEGYEIDDRIVVIKGSGRLRSYRPRWNNWEFEFKVRYDQSNGKLIDRNTLATLMQYAGKIGIGTYRLKFGKFRVVSVTELKSSGKKPMEGR